MVSPLVFPRQALGEVPKTHRETIAQQHRVHGFLSQAVDKVNELVEVYRDSDSSRQEELETMGTGYWYSQFYDRLRYGIHAY